ncbi:MAG: Na+/H+ antiporter NhaC family protein [Lachnospiraceae bacterium]|nr:Na+/H+ antiporter NhaC family protein [Lachnospiraceae bacterium]
MKRRSIQKIIINIIVVIILIALIIMAFRGRDTDMTNYSPALYGTFLSLLPPIVAIVLALITKEVYSSLFTGIVVGGLLYAGGNAEHAFNTILYHEEAGLIPNLTDLSHVSVLVFVVLLGTLVVLMNRSGSAQAFGKWAEKHIKSRVGAQLATILMGILIFVDDGFNCMTVGSVMRPMTDSHKVSRAKLAYLLDSTAAPICIIAPISCWAAAVSYAVPEQYHINGFRMFLETIPYNLYALTTLFMLFLLVLRKTDYGPMRLHERNALKGDLFTTGENSYAEEETVTQVPNAKLSNLIIPVVVLIVCCIAGMAYTGGLFDGESLIDSFANADSARGLVMGSLIGVLITFWLYMNRRVMKFKEFMNAFPAGFRSMCAPMIILILSWNLSGVTRLLGAADFVHTVVESSAASLQMFVPAAIFVISVFLAFSTGTSWGTFTILIPIVCAVFPATSEMLVISISACLAGAVCGDHCSPISDTTIMSSAGAHCNHINHVTTQIPYAMTAAAVSAVGYLAAGIIGFYSNSKLALLGTPFALLVLFIVVMLISRRETKKA